MSTTLNVNIIDPTGQYAQYDSNIRNTVTDAFNAWISLFDYTTGSITLNVGFSSLPNSLLSAGPDYNSPVGFNGIGIYGSSTALEISTGVTSPNGDPNAAINLNENFVTTAFNPVITSDNFLDRLGIVESAIGNILGYEGYYDSATQQLTSTSGAFLRETTYDQYVVFSAGTPYFTGPNAEAVYGGQVPLYKAPLYYPMVPGQISVMSSENQAMSIQNLDVAILQDAGLPILTQQEADEHAVIRLYKAAFARQGDAGGDAYFTDTLVMGGSLDDVAAGFISSAEFQGLYGTNPSNDTFVDALYQNVLGRAADVGGLAYWDGVLQNGDSRADVLNQFAQSDENRSNLNVDPNISYSSGVEGEVLRMYDAAYGRAPDSGGYEYWTKALYAGMDLTTLASDFAVTPEFTAKYGADLSDTGFVDALYANTLLRTPSSGEEQYWSSLLANGSLTRGQELLDFPIPQSTSPTLQLPQALATAADLHLRHRQLSVSSRN